MTLFILLHYYVLFTSYFLEMVLRNMSSTFHSRVEGLREVTEGRMPSRLLLPIVIPLRAEALKVCRFNVPLATARACRQAYSTCGYCCGGAIESKRGVGDFEGSRGEGAGTPRWYRWDETELGHNRHVAGL